MRLGLITAATGLAGLALAASPLAAAAAETTVPFHSVTVEGVSEVPISATADQATAIAAYRSAMTAAVADARAKAQFLVAQTGSTLAPVSPGIVEGSGYINCPGELQYTGRQPDWGSGGIVSAPPIAAARGAASPVVHHKRRKHHIVKKATTASCELSTNLMITYVLET